MKHHPDCALKTATYHGDDCQDVNGNFLQLPPIEPAPERGHHPHCDSDKNHRGVCRDTQGEPLRLVYLHHAQCANPVDDHTGPCTDKNGEPLGHKTDVIIPKPGEGVSQYEDLEFQEEQVGEVVEGEVWKGTFMPHARPDGPRVEMTISDETGVSITVAAEIDASLREHYDHDMLSHDVVAHARRLYDGIIGARP